MIKMSFIGDIMCEPLLLKAAKRQDGTYDFSGVFEHVKPLLDQSDYVVGNLETPLAGKEARYVHELFAFNAPDEFADAIKNAGIRFVSTANNHCMDRGLEGLKRTVQVLDEKKIAHDGTHDDPTAANEPYIAVVGDNKVAILPFTYGTNYRLHHQALPDDAYVDLLFADTGSVYLQKKGKQNKIKSLLLEQLKPEQIAAIKKALGRPQNTARKDDGLDEQKAAPFFEKIEEKIKKAREQADIVVFYPHVGGQFNTEPGRFTEYTVERALAFGVDAIIAAHPHVVQKAIDVNGVPVFYSIGNFSMSPNSVYLLHENLPDYGLAVHLYIEDKKIVRTTFSVLKIIEPKGKMLTVWPIDMLAKPNEEDIKKLFKAVTGNELSGKIVRHEYEM